MVTVHHSTDNLALEKRRDDYERLLIETGAPLTARMTSILLWRINYTEWHPLVVEVADRGALVAVALLGYRRRPGWIEVVRLGPQDQAGWLAARDAAALRHLCDGIHQALDQLKWPWRMQLLHLRNSDEFVLNLIDTLRYSQVTRVTLSSHVHVAMDRPFTQVTSHNTRSAVAKARNRIASQGHALDLVWIRDPEDVAALLPQVDRVHQERNRQLRGTVGLDYPGTSKQFRERMTAYAGEDRMRLLLATIDGELAAFAACQLDGRSLYVYENLTSPDWLRFSPGTIANHEVVASAWADPGLDVVDWGLGLQRYKLSGASETVSHHCVQAISSETLERVWQVQRIGKDLLEPH